MIRKAADIMDTSFITVSALECVSNIKRMASDKQIKYFPVIEVDKIIGVITYEELVTAHPNRIAADAMSAHFMAIDLDMPIWETKYIYEQKNIKAFLVQEDEKIIGIITSSILDIEFGKHIDLLTGLHKRDYLFYNALMLINKEIEISLIFIDVNNFGIIDKKYGHICGDKILKEIALLLDTYKPKGTYLCRFGGDEFVLLTPFNADTARKVAEDILKTISAKTFQKEVKITVSAGISGGRRNNKRITDVYSTVLHLTNTASLACAEAKNNSGKLCIEFAPEIIDIA